MNTPTGTAPLFLRVPRAAELLAMDPRTVRRGIEQGVIPAVRVGGSIRVPMTWIRQAAGLPQDTTTA